MTLMMLAQLPVEVAATPQPTVAGSGGLGSTAYGTPPVASSSTEVTHQQASSGVSNQSPADDWCDYGGNINYECHVYVGAVYSGANASVSSIQFTLSIPNGTPVGNGNNELYYLLDSIWDNGNAYDQIGIADAGQGSYYTSWTLMYSAWSVCSSLNPISWNNSAYTLTPGDQYSFRMVAHSNGTIEFDLYPGTNYFMPWWTAWVHTGGTSLEKSAYSPSGPSGCPGFQGYTDYEEMYQITGGAQPSWNFAFGNNLANGQAQTSWVPFQSHCGWMYGKYPPGDANCTTVLDQVWSDLAAYATTSGSVVSIWNQWFTNSFAPTICVPDEGWCELSINKGTMGTFSGSVTDSPSCSQGLQSNGIQAGYCTSSSIDVDFLLSQFPTAPIQSNNLGGCGYYNVASGGCVCPTASGGWTCYFTGSGIANNSGFVPYHGGLPFNYALKIGVPSTAACGLYLLRYNLTIEYSNGVNGPQWDWNSFEFAVLVGGCGGGGCVAWGTPILTANGYLPVQRLVPGEILVGYNLTTGQLVNETLEADSSTWVDSVVIVNGGALVVTPTDQPIFVKNMTFSGWLRDPQNLTIGDWMLDPVSGNWTLVYSLTLQHKHTKVFDVVTNGPNDFIANGILLDRKA